MASAVAHAWPVQLWSMNANSLALAPVMVALVALSVMVAPSAPRLRISRAVESTMPPIGAEPTLKGLPELNDRIDCPPVPLAAMLATVSPVGSLLSSMSKVAVRVPAPPGLNSTVMVPAGPPGGTGKPVSMPARIWKSVGLVPVKLATIAAYARSASPVLLMVRTLVAVEPVPVMFQRTAVANVRSPVTTRRGASLSPLTPTVGSTPVARSTVMVHDASATRELGVKVTSTVTLPSVLPTRTGTVSVGCENDRAPPQPALCVYVTPTAFMLSSLVTVNVIGVDAVFMVTTPKSIVVGVTAIAAWASRTDHTNPSPRTSKATGRRPRM